MTVKYPTLVNKLATLCNAWLIGSSADPSNDNPRDFDVFIPVQHWSMACGLIDEDAKINTFGGFKCVSDGVEVDVWTGNMDEFLATNNFKFAYHPRTNIRISRI